MAGKEGGRSPGKFIIQPVQGEPGSRRENPAGTQLAPLMDPEILKKLSHTPEGEDPLFYPLYVLNEMLYHIATRTDPATAGSITRAIGEKYAPYQASIRRVRTAYTILAYPHLTYYKPWQTHIEGELETDRQLAGRDQVELTDDERLALSRLATAKQLPFDSDKKVYSYSEVPISPGIDPCGRRHLTTEAIRNLIPRED